MDASSNTCSNGSTTYLANRGGRRLVGGNDGTVQQLHQIAVVEFQGEADFIQNGMRSFFIQQQQLEGCRLAVIRACVTDVGTAGERQPV